MRGCESSLATHLAFFATSRYIPHKLGISNSHFYFQWIHPQSRRTPGKPNVWPTHHVIIVDSIIVDYLCDASTLFKTTRSPAIHAVFRWRTRTIHTNRLQVPRCWWEFPSTSWPSVLGSPPHGQIRIHHHQKKRWNLALCELRLLTLLDTFNSGIDS